MLSKHGRYYGWAWLLWCAYALEIRTLLWFGHGCTVECMLSKHERYYGLGMDAFGTDALVSRMRWKTDVMMAWAWSKNGLTKQYGKICKNGAR